MDLNTFFGNDNLIIDPIEYNDESIIVYVNRAEFFSQFERESIKKLNNNDDFVMVIMKGTLNDGSITKLVFQYNQKENWIFVVSRYNIANPNIIQAYKLPNKNDFNKFYSDYLDTNKNNSYFNLKKLNEDINFNRDIVSIHTQNIIDISSDDYSLSKNSEFYITVPIKDSKNVVKRDFIVYNKSNNSFYFIDNKDYIFSIADIIRINERDKKAKPMKKVVDKKYLSYLGEEGEGDL